MVYEILLAFLALLLLVLLLRYRKLYMNEKFSRSSLSVRYGKTIEHALPWFKDFPGDPRSFRFIGDPVDGILFGNDAIHFIEFKSSRSKLSPKQNKIRDLVEKKLVKWKVIRIGEEKDGV